MSERGSFCTEYIYCDGCLASLEHSLINDEDPVIHGVKILGRVIAGFISGMYPGEEIIRVISRSLLSTYPPCHPIRIAIHADNGTSVILLIAIDGDVNLLSSSAAPPLDAPSAQAAA